MPGAESPSRLAVTLKRLHDGLAAIGADTATRWSLVRRVALDSMPALRRHALETVARLGEPNTTAVATALRYPTQTTRRALEDLAAYDVLQRLPAGKGKADGWRLTPWVTKRCLTVPDTSGGLGRETETAQPFPVLLSYSTNNNISGKVADAPLDGAPVAAETEDGVREAQEMQDHLTGGADGPA